MMMKEGVWVLGESWRFLSHMSAGKIIGDVVEVSMQKKETNKCWHAVAS